MNKPHKHADVIIAWANGDTIEYYNDTMLEWRVADCPQWSPYTHYRVKPKPVIKKKFIYAQHFEDNKTLMNAQIWNEGENSIETPIIQVTLTDGKVTAVELTK